ncbi:MAG: hypothetical protein E6R03_08630, partial [Hyphomicrobiaceae bacterium]
TGDVDTASFTTAAATLYAENFGLSLAWTTEGTAEEFVNLIVSHIGATIYPAPDTGKYTLKLVRNDYVVGDTMVIDPSNVIAMRSFQRASTADLTNEVTIQYRDPDQDKDAKVTVQNLAAIRSVGRVVRRVIEYPGIRNGDLAARVAQRELLTLSTPLAKVSLEVNLTAWNLRPGDVFRFSWPKLGITQLVMRVLDVEYGDLRSGKIMINAVEDQFDLPSASYVSTLPPVWEPVPTGLADITSYKLFELPYFAIIQSQGEDYASYLSDNRNFTGAIAARNNGLWTGYELHENVGGTYTFRETGTFSPWVGITNAAGKLPTDNVWVYATFYDDGEIEVGDLGIIDNEWVQVSAIDTAAQTITVERGVLDTIPAAHIAGSRLWVVGENALLDYSVQRLSGETVTYKLLPETGDEILPIASATARALTLTGRQERPYPPGNVQIAGSYYPSSVQEEFAVTWAHRDRTIQTADPIPWSSASVSLEAGVTYTIQLYRSTDNVLLTTLTGITTATQTVGVAELGEEENVRLNMFSVKSALNSLQTYTHDFTRVISTDDYSLQVLADTPLGYWRLGDLSGTSAADSSGNARTGTRTGTTMNAGALLALTTLNKATSFNGTSDYITVPYVAALAPTAAVSVEVWIQMSSLPTADASIVSKTETGGYALVYDHATTAIAFKVRRNSAFALAGYALTNFATATPYHLVGTYDGRYARLYVNGVLVATNDAGASYAITYGNSNSLAIGAEIGATTAVTGGYFAGVIDEVAVYGSALSAERTLAHYKVGKNTATAAEDTFFERTALLLHMDGADGSTTFTDVKAKTVTPSGNAQISTAQSKFGGASGLFDGTGDFLTVAHSTDFSITGDITVEAWVYPTNLTGVRYIARKGTSTTYTTGWALAVNAGFPYANVGTSSGTIDSPVALTLNTWQHVAFTKRGGTLRMFIDGVLVNTVSGVTGTDVTASLTIGRDSAATARDWVGHIEELRITRGCRYYKTFTPQTAAFPDVAVS